MKKDGNLNTQELKVKTLIIKIMDLFRWFKTTSKIFMNTIKHSKIMSVTRMLNLISPVNMS